MRAWSRMWMRAQGLNEGMEQTVDGAQILNEGLELTVDKGAEIN